MRFHRLPVRDRVVGGSNPLAPTNPSYCPETGLQSPARWVPPRTLRSRSRRDAQMDDGKPDDFRGGKLDKCPGRGSTRMWLIGYLILLAAGCAAGAQLATAPEGAGGSAILAIKPVTFPAYDSYRGIARYAPTREDYARAVADPGFVMERVTYRSDDLDVHAYLYRPAIPPKEKLPVVIFNRGSHVRDDFSPEVLMPGNRLARQGYVVLAPMLRGSGGAQGHDEMGGATSTICSAFSAF